MMPSEHGQELRAPPCMHRSNLGPHRNYSGLSHCPLFGSESAD
jgi:hypothetical protein